MTERVDPKGKRQTIDERREMAQTPKLDWRKKKREHLAQKRERKSVQFGFFRGMGVKSRANEVGHRNGDVGGGGGYCFDQS